MKHIVVSALKRHFRLFLIAASLVVVLLAALPYNHASVFSATPAHAQAASNPITIENAQPGSTGWQFDLDSKLNPLKAADHEIEGYASATSVNKGGQISFMVSLNSSAQYTMAIYRMGYYPTGTNPDGSACVGPCGGRLMQTIGPLNGFKQATCPTTTTQTNFGLTECQWTTSYTLTVPTTWTTGSYIVKLRRTDTGLEEYMTFVVRDDNTPADIVLSEDVNTWQAYNFWGGAGNNNVGYNLYGKFDDKTYNNTSSARAYAVSFDRPYIDQGAQDGAGNLMVWDYPMIRWLEANGYNVTYATDVDIETNPNLLNGRKAFINTGHDEYYSATMRNNLQGFINTGHHIGFFSANNIYFQVRWGNSPSGQQYRRIICYKDQTLDATTIRWRDLSPPQPENSIVGVMQNGVASDRPYEVYDSTSWIYAGTGLVNYTSGTPKTSSPGQNAIAGLVGYEFDERAANDASLATFTSSEPPGLQQVGHSNVPASDNGIAAFSDATLYTASSGAIVFAAGTIQWSWGVDNGVNDGFCDCNPGDANSKSQQITANILNKFLSTTATPSPAVSLSPTSVNFGNQLVNTSSAAQTVTLTDSGTGALTITSIGLAGTNANDFTQTNNCPLSPSTLAAGASCTVSVTFTPTVATAESASLTIADNATGSPQSVALSGTGTTTSSPAVSLSPSSLSFNTQNVGTSSTAQTVTLTDSGAGALTITGITIGGTNAGDFTQTNNCPLSPSTLAAGASCTVSVTFTPIAGGTRTASLSISDNAAGSPQSVPLSGSAITAGTYFFDGFESGNFSQWTVPSFTGKGTVQSSVVNSGSYAAAFTNTSGQYVYLYSDLAGGSQTSSYTRFYFRISSLATTTPIAYGRDVNGNNLWEVDFDASRKGLDVYFWNGARTRYNITTNKNVLSANTWYSIELQSTETTSGHGQVWLNGTSIGSVNNDLSVTNGYSRLFLYSSAPTTAYFDDVKVANSYNGPVNPTPAVSLSPSSLSFANQAVGTSSTAQTVTLTDSGTGTLTITAISISGTNASDFAQTNTCPISPSTLAPGASCTVNVIFTPTVAAAESANLTFADNATGSPQSVALSGTGITPAPAVSLSPSSLSFNTQNVGTSSAAQTVTLTDSGAGALTITTISIGGTNAGDFTQTNNCPLSPSTLAAGASCIISTTFAPTATGTRTASLSISDNAAGSPQSVSLSGSAITAGTYFSDGFESGNFSQWTTPSFSGTASVQSAVVNSGNYAASFTNSGGQYAYLYSDLASGAQTQTYTRFYFRFASMGGSSPIALGRDINGNNLWEIDYDGSRKGLDVYFWNGARTRYNIYSNKNVLSANTWYSIELQSTQTTSGHGEVWLNGASIGSVNADLSVTNGYSRLFLYDEANGTAYFDDVKVANSYNGPVNPTPAVSLSPTSLSFANQVVGTSSAAQTVTLTDSGTGTLTITAINISGTNASDFAQTNTCPSTLAAGASCTVNVTFTPSVAAAESASLTFADNAAGSPQSVALSGTGITPAPAVSLSPSSLSFNTQNVGTSSTAQTVTLTDSGAGALTITTISVGGTNAGDFSQTDTCPISPSTLAAGASCTVSVTFTPTSGGSRIASLSISDNAAGSPQSASLSGSAIAAGTYFSDGFESGNFSQWTVPSFSGTANVQSAVVNSGSYAASFTNTSGQYVYLYSDLASGAQTQTYTRFYFRISSLATTTPIAYGRDINGNNLWEVDFDAGRQGIDVYFWNGARVRYDVYSNTNVLNADTWYSIEVQSTETTTGHGEAWLNGSSIGSVDGDLSVTNGYSRLFLYDEAPGTAYFDDVKVTNSYNGTTP